MEVGTLWREVVASMRPITEWHRLLPSFHARHPIGSSCDLLSSTGRATGLSTFRLSPTVG